ncbi:hypothetical protein ACFQ1M_04750 [Sungkyunkwania multivorans]|uniref:Uncharacterized protein n=1 Tax=Sungkyunkwania multivorans TaxID=1173618 RepID=A0ABW3CVG9_9FLAO
MLRKISLVAFLALSISCSSDNEADFAPIQTGTFPFDLTVLATAPNLDSRLHQYQIQLIEGQTRPSSVTDLTDELGLDLDLRVQVEGAVVTFHDLIDCKVWRKNVITDERAAWTDFFNNDGECFYNPIFISSQEKLLNFHVDCPDSFYTINSYDTQSENTADIEIPPLYLLFDDIFVAGEFLFVKYEDDNSDRWLDIYDLENSQKVTTLDINTFDTYATSGDRLYLIAGAGAYTIFNIRNRQVEATVADSNLGWVSGFAHANLLGNKMATDVFYPQPSNLVKTPAIYDFGSNKLRSFDLQQFRTVLADESIILGSVHDYVVDLESEIVAISYSYGDVGGLQKHRLTFVTFDGEIIASTALEQTPYRLISN